MLYLLRHGQTEANLRGVLLGRSDPCLTELGRRQAEAARSVMPASATVVTSPLTRTRESATLALPGAHARVDERWIEVDYGDYESRRLDELPADVLGRWRSDPAFRPPGGESLRAVAARVADALASLAQEAREGDVVVVSHVSPIKAAVAWALGAGPEVAWRLFLAPAAVSRIATGPPPSLLSFNGTAHLDGLR